MDMTGKIHSIESFGTVDGPGIRFVIFLQGCPMRCLYCHNPDTWAFEGGTEMTVEELLKQYDGVKEFMRGGGITCTGGEPLMQTDFLIELFEKAHERGIHTCLDTSGIAFNQKQSAKFERLAAVTDLVMLDIKHIDPVKHKELTGQDNANILDFAHFLSEHKVPVWIRHVVVPGITDDEKTLFRLGEAIASIKTLKALDVLPYHTMGKAKYQALGLDYPLGDTPPLPTEKAVEARKQIISGLKHALAEKTARQKQDK